MEHGQKVEPYGTNALFQGNLKVLGSLSVQTILVNGHIMTSGEAPSVTPGQAAGEPKVTEGITDASTIPVVTIDGNDSAGTITIKTGVNNLEKGDIAALAFAKGFDGPYKVVISASNKDASTARVYVSTNDKGFSIVSEDVLNPGAEYR